MGPSPSPSRASPTAAEASPHPPRLGGTSRGAGRALLRGAIPSPLPPPLPQWPSCPRQPDGGSNRSTGNERIEVTGASSPFLSPAGLANALGGIAKNCTSAPRLYNRVNKQTVPENE